MFKRKEINGSPLNFRLPKELKAKIRGVAVEHKITLSDVIREILNEYFKCHHSSNQKIMKEREDAAIAPLSSANVILAFLIKRSGKKFKHVPANLKLITARLSEGSSESELLAVINYKCNEWENDPKMAKYIRPATLFNAEKFNQYVGELEVETPQDKKRREINDWINEDLEDGITEGVLYEN